MMMGGVKGARRFLLNVLFPVRCLSCAAYDTYLCDRCARAAERASLRCPVCGEVSFYGARHTGCGKARRGLTGFVSIWRYRGPVRKAIHAVKYSKISDAVRELVRRACDVMERDALRYEPFLQFARGAVFTYVPMRIRAEDARGFNQTRLITEKLSRYIGAPICDMLCKVKNISSQTLLSGARERIKNVHDAFAVRDGAAVPARIVIINDVWTSGATMKSCARVLRAGGAREVWGFTLTQAV